MDGFEYAIKKDVRNNPIVREVDEARHRQQWRWACVAGFLVTMVLFWAWQNYILLRNSFSVADIAAQITEEVRRGQRLHVELDSLLAPAVIEKRAAEMHLVQPTGDESIILQRVLARSHSSAHCRPPRSHDARRLAGNGQAAPRRRRDRPHLLGGEHRGQARLPAGGALRRLRETRQPAADREADAASQAR
jgi:hypothetical protein